MTGFPAAVFLRCLWSKPFPFAGRVRRAQAKKGRAWYTGGMPAYPCDTCENPVSTDGVGHCKKCGDRSPFRCSKCDRKVSLDEVFQPERLAYRKPLLCRTCGEMLELVECRQCGIRLVRSVGTEVTVKGEARIYHTECYEKQLRIHRIVQPLVITFGIILFGYFGSMVAGPVAFVGAILGAGIGWRVARIFLPR